MKAILFSYSTKGLSKSEGSKISKKLIGYKDKSNQGKYNYQRKGLIQLNKGIIISKSTFIIPEKKESILGKIKVKGLKINKWKINIHDSYFLH